MELKKDRAVGENRIGVIRVEMADGLLGCNPMAFLTSSKKRNRTTGEAIGEGSLPR